MAEVKLGFIGCGGMAQSHMKALSSIPEAKLEAFADIALERAQACSKTYGGKAYGSYEEMLNRETLDAVYICIPPFAHTDQELLCVKKEIPFLVEKPVALTIEKAKEVCEAVMQKKLITQVGYVLRFNNAYASMRSLFRKEAGHPVFFEAYRYGGVAGGPEHWWRRKEYSGGQLVEQSTHIVDLVRWFIDEDAETVYAKFDYDLLKDLPNFNIEDFSTVVVKFKKGSLATITSSCAAKKGLSGFIALSQKIQLEAMGGSYIARVDGQTTEFKSTVDAVSAEDKHFLECVSKGSETTIPYTEGLKSLEITLAAVKSADTGRPVKLPL